MPTSTDTHPTAVPSGSSSSPSARDHHGPLPDGDVPREVTKDGQWVYGTAGHHAEIPATDLSPGTYDVRFVAQDAGNDYDAIASFEVLAVPEGEDAPTASILSPEIGDVFGVSGAHQRCDGIDVELDLDPAIGDIDGDGLMDPTQ
jgi:hypothetical protein